MLTLWSRFKETQIVRVARSLSAASKRYVQFALLLSFGLSFLLLPHAEANEGEFLLKVAKYMSHSAVIPAERSMIDESLLRLWGTPAITDALSKMTLVPNAQLVEELKMIMNGGSLQAFQALLLEYQLIDKLQPRDAIYLGLIHSGDVEHIRYDATTESESFLADRDPLEAHYGVKNRYLFGRRLTRDLEQTVGSWIEMHRLTAGWSYGELSQILREVGLERSPLWIERAETGRDARLDEEVIAELTRIFRRGAGESFVPLEDVWNRTEIVSLDDILLGITGVPSQRQDLRNKVVEAFRLHVDEMLSQLPPQKRSKVEERVLAKIRTSRSLGGDEGVRLGQYFGRMQVLEVPKGDSVSSIALTLILVHEIDHAIQFMKHPLYIVDNIWINLLYRSVNPFLRHTKLLEISALSQEYEYLKRLADSGVRESDLYFLIREEVAHWKLDEEDFWVESENGSERVAVPIKRYHGLGQVMANRWQIFQKEGGREEYLAAALVPYLKKIESEEAGSLFTRWVKRMGLGWVIIEGLSQLGCF